MTKITATPMMLSSKRCLNHNITQWMDQLISSNSDSQEMAAPTLLTLAISMTAKGVNSSTGIKVSGETKDRSSKNRMIHDLEMGRWSKLSSSNTGKPCAKYR